MSYASICCSTPEYQSALADKGFSTSSSVVYQGRTISHDEIAESFDRAYRRRKDEFPMVCGAKPRQERKRRNDLEARVRKDVYGDFGISWTTIALGALMFALSGPLGLIVCVVSAMLTHYITKDLEGDKVFAAAMQ